MIAVVHQACYTTAVVKNNKHNPHIGETVHLTFIFVILTAFDNLPDPILLLALYTCLTTSSSETPLPTTQIDLPPSPDCAVF